MKSFSAWLTWVVLVLKPDFQRWDGISKKAEGIEKKPFWRRHLNVDDKVEEVEQLPPDDAESLPVPPVHPV